MAVKYSEPLAQLLVKIMGNLCLRVKDLECHVENEPTPVNTARIPVITGRIFKSGTTKDVFRILIDDQEKVTCYFDKGRLSNVKCCHILNTYIHSFCKEHLLELDLSVNLS